MELRDWEINYTIKYFIQHYTKLDSILKSRHYFVNKSPSSQGYGFSSGHVWMWDLDCEESWALKNWCFWTVVLEKTLGSPLDCKETQPVHPKGNQFWIFIGRTDAEAETPILLATWCKELTHWKRPWCWERLKAGEGDNRGWDSWMVDGITHSVDMSLSRLWYGSLACCSPWGCKESDTELNWATELNYN